MGKTGKALKKRRLAQFSSAHVVTHTADDVSDDDPNVKDKLFLGGVISESQLAITIKTLSTLADFPDSISQHRSQLKRLRGAVHDFQRISAIKEGTGNSLTSRISSALSDNRWTDAKVLLAEMRIRKQRPRLGALQRWTRECDAASTADGSDGDWEVLSVLDAIMRTAEDDAEGNVNPVRRHTEWVGRGLYRPSEGLFEAASNNTLFGMVFTIYVKCGKYNINTMSRSIGRRPDSRSVSYLFKHPRAGTEASKPAPRNRVCLLSQRHSPLPIYILGLTIILHATNNLLGKTRRPLRTRRLSSDFHPLPIRM
jgi:hypothetical protein